MENMINLTRLWMALDFLVDDETYIQWVYRNNEEFLSLSLYRGLNTYTFKLATNKNTGGLFSQYVVGKHEAIPEIKYKVSNWIDEALKEFRVRFGWE